MKTKIPPPIVAIVAAVAIWFIATSDWMAKFESPYLMSIAAIVFVIGLAIDVSSILTFRKARTTVNPMNPEKASTLVTTGVFRFSRNPMYLGLLVMLAATVIWFGSFLSIFVLVFFVLYMNKLQIEPEEDAMNRLFADDYAKYKANVGRWI